MAAHRPLSVSHLLVTVLVLLAGEPQSFAGETESPRAGKVREMSLRQDVADPDLAIFEIQIEPAYPDGTQPESGELLPGFDEETMVIGGEDTRMSVVLDRIGAFGYKFENGPKIPFLRSVVLQDLRGSYKDPDKMLDADGREYRSLKITIESRTAIFYRLIDINRDNPEVVILRFGVQVAPKRTVDEDFLPTVTLNVNDVAPRPGVVLPGSEGHASLDENLRKVPESSFVSVLVPLRHLEPDRAAGLIKNRSSLLGDISIDRDNPALLITDRADYVRSMTAALRLLDRPVPQAMIEVRILEVTWKEEERLGFNWHVNAAEGNVLGDRDVIRGKTASGGLGTLMRDGASQALSGVVLGRVSDRHLNLVSAQLDLLSKEGRVKLLASTRLKVMNNHRATFHAGSTIPVFNRNNVSVTDSRSGNTDYSRDTNRTRNSSYDLQDSTDGTGSTNWTDRERFGRDRDSNHSATIEMQERNYKTGVRLNVTPNIREGGEVTLELAPSVTEVSGWRQPSDMPILNTREMTTTLKARGGDSILIAGLFREASVNEESGIPGLKKVPGVGRLFRTDQKQVVKSEIVFLLKLAVVE